MKKTLIAFAALSFAGFALASSAHANDGRTVTFEIGATVHNELYEEFTDDGKLMQEKGMLYGVKGAVTRHFSPVSKFTLSGEVAQGESTYTGAYWGGTYGDLKLKGLSRSYFDVSGVYAHSFRDLSGLALSAGLGYRQLTDNLQEGGPGGYKRVNDLAYATFGVEQPIKNGNWTVTPGVRYKHMLFGQQHSDLYGGVTVDQNSGSGSELYVSISNRHNNMVVTPYLRNWSVKDSEVSPEGLYEPRNKTREVGVSVTWRF